jgi:hypothetical protein
MSLVCLLQDAYRRWVCASLFPHFLPDSAERARPCRSVCQQVEQRCPFFLPGDRFPSYPTQYAGEPAFLCLGAYTVLTVTVRFSNAAHQLQISKHRNNDISFLFFLDHGLLGYDATYSLFRRELSPPSSGRKSPDVSALNMEAGGPYEIPRSTYMTQKTIIEKQSTSQNLRLRKVSRLHTAPGATVNICITVHTGLFLEGLN